LFGAFVEPGTHQRRLELPPVPRNGPGGQWKPGIVAPDDDPEFLRKLGEQMRKDRPEG
jgi:hypothetical protein